MGAAFLVASFLQMLGAKVTLFHHQAHRLCGCCTQAEFGWRWQELSPIAQWIDEQVVDMTNPNRAWYIIADIIDHWLVGLPWLDTTSESLVARHC